MAAGGKREGAGRKKGQRALLNERFNIYVSEILEKEKKPLIEALLKKAKDGDIPAIKELFDRALGRAPQHVEHGTDDNFSELILSVFKKLNDN